jgi:hypothetical protein
VACRNRGYTHAKDERGYFPARLAVPGREIKTASDGSMQAMETMVETDLCFGGVTVEVRAAEETKRVATREEEMARATQEINNAGTRNIRWATRPVICKA